MHSRAFQSARLRTFQFRLHMVIHDAVPRTFFEAFRRALVIEVCTMKIVMYYRAVTICLCGFERAFGARTFLCGHKKTLEDERSISVKPLQRQSSIYLIRRDLHIRSEECEIQLKTQQKIALLLRNSGFPLFTHLFR